VSVRRAPEPLSDVAAADWDGLLDACAIGDPLRRMSVLAAICTTTGRDGWMVAVRRDAQLVAGAPLWPERERGLRVWRHLGHSLNWFCPAPPAIDDAAREELATRLLALPGDLLALEELDPDDPLLELLSSRTTVRLRHEPPTYRVRTNERRSSMHRRRREVGRMMRRATDRGAPFEVDVTEAGAEIASVLPELLALQASAWADRDADHMTATADGRGLVTAILGALAAEDRLHLVRVRNESQTVGFTLSALAPPRAVMFKMAHDRSLSGVGWIGITRSLDSLGERGVEIVDLGSGGDHFKPQMADPEPQVTAQVALSHTGRGFLFATGLARKLIRRT
jgi:CelD/BcsL family acetyltransferase involved in cellulose biosynthesis